MERVGNFGLEGPWVDPRILGLFWLPFLDPWSQREPALDPKILGVPWLDPLNRSVSHWGITLWVPWVVS